VARARQAGRPPAAFWEQSTGEVARALLGCRLVRRVPGSAPRVLVIVETEAYLGVDDPAAHTWNGRRTPRVEPMWGPAGHAYVFRVYGVHDCLNVVTREEGVPEAVLLRAAVPVAWWRGERSRVPTSSPRRGRAGSAARSGSRGSFRGSRFAGPGWSSSSRSRGRRGPSSRVRASASATPARRPGGRSVSQWRAARR
jgi:3-methyladenine DNA glycosylase Mpg